MNAIELQELDVKSPKQQTIKVNTGISGDERKKIADGLQILIADSYCLLLMTQNYHWNIQGGKFRELHLMTEEQYLELFTAIDVVAERVRALGFLVDGTLKFFNDNSSINLPNKNLSQQEMTVDLLNANETVVRTARSLVDLASKSTDEVTVDLLTQRMQQHEKNAWMLRSMLEQ